MKKCFLLLILICSISLSQNTFKKCNVKSSGLAFERDNHAKVSAVELVAIPVHIIVIHKSTEAIGEGRNVSWDQIYSQINVLNEDFRKLNPSASNTPEEFAPVAADCMIEFCLASVDPNGNPTDGVTRYVYDSNQVSENYWEDVISQETFWDPTYYLNIWVARLNNNAGDGFAYMPSDGVPDYLDGVVVKDIYFGKGGSAQWPFDEGHLTTHEVGHWFGVDHTWDAWDNYSCNIDDGIADTPEQYEEYYDCPSYPQYSCNSSDMFMNFMDYVDDACLTLWTEGQKELMHEVILNYRTELLNNPYGCDIMTSIHNVNEIEPKSIIKKIDLLGRETSQKGLYICIYNDGSVDKKYILK